MIMKKIAEENCTITEFQRTNGTIKGDFVTYDPLLIMWDQVKLSENAFSKQKTGSHFTHRPVPLSVC